MCNSRRVFLEQVECLSNVRNETGYSISKKTSIKRFKKIMAILDNLRMRGTKLDAQFMAKLNQNILTYFHCPDNNVDTNIDEI